MSLGMPSYGLQGLLKEGHRHLSGLEESVLKNIEACRQLSQITRTSMGPNGMNKLLINRLEKLFVTSDAGTILEELEVQHPAAKLIVFAARSQMQEVGDGANLVVSLAGELLIGAEELIRSGLHPSDVIEGYTKAGRKVLCLLEDLVEPGSEQMDVRSKDEVVKRLIGPIGSKQYGQEAILALHVAEACIQVCPTNPNNFNVDNVRVSKIPGGGINDCHVIRGMVLKGDTVGTIQKAHKAKIAVFGQGLDTQGTETKGTVLIENAAQLENYAKTEENRVEELIKSIADTGVTVVVSGQSIGEIALHFCERYNLLVLKILSKFELRRFCRTTGAISLLKLQAPSADEIGFVDSLTVQEIGGTKVVVVKSESGGNLISTIVLRGSTESGLEDLERAVDDGVNSYKAMCRDSRVVAGAGASEMELAIRLREFARTETSLDQYAIDKFAEAFEVVPRTLAENAGLAPADIVSALYAAHSSSPSSSPSPSLSNACKIGVDVDGGEVRDMTNAIYGVYDLFLTKYWAIRFAYEAATTVLRVDQIIMAKSAGGPRKPDKSMGDEEED